MTTSYFHIANYIVGKPDKSLIPMTIGATGVKIYTALDYATIFNVSLSSEYKFSKQLKWSSQLVYTRGKDLNNVNLPFMSPLNYTTSLSFVKDKISTEIVLQGNAKQVNYSEIYGEDKTPDYAVVDVNFGYKLKFGKNGIVVNTGVENVFDAYYSTYSDWNNFPRMGRNFFLNFNYNL